MRVILILLLCASIACGEKDSKEPSDPSNSLEYQLANWFDNEVRPMQSATCFQGAYYRKAVSSTDYWLGIEGTVVLPELHYDSTRINPAKPKTLLDNASVYIGGKSGNQETDIGLTWEVVKDEYGNVSPERLAFRPFMRRTGYSPTGQAALYLNAPAESRYYWYPGDVVTLSVKLVADTKLKFTVSGNGKLFEQEFDVDGYRFASKAEYKRVNAIDQVSNEGKPIQPTKTEILNAKWQEVFLFRKYKGEVLSAVFHPGRFTDMRCPAEAYFNVKQYGDKSSKEDINIIGK